jgi:hypothetical protein
MKFFKIFILFLATIVLSGCVQTTALLGPGITMVSTGNIMQAGFQYGANTAIKNETGKDTFELLKDTIENKKEEKKFKKKFTELVKTRFETTRKKLSTN